MRETVRGWPERLERALRWATLAHDGQVRKSSRVPYIEHPMAVALILDRSGFPEDVVIAGLLHDLVEDTDATLDDVRTRFGAQVAEIVEGCTEIKLDAEGRKRPWADRKRDHLAALSSAPVATKAVVLADKLHNLACIALDLDDRLPVWETFNAPRHDVIVYYKASLATCLVGDPQLEVLAEEVDTLLKRVERAAKSSDRAC